MTILSKAYKLLSHIKFKVWGHKTGKGRRVRALEWDKEFDDGCWEYLKNDQQAPRYEAILAILNDSTTSPAILDVGCGEGILVDYLKRGQIDFSDYLGLDISGQAINKARERHPEVKFDKADVEKQLPDSKYDIIIFNECVYYFRSPLAVLQAFEKCLSDSGIYIISVFNVKDYEQIQEKIYQSYRCINSKAVSDGSSERWTISVLAPLNIRKNST